MSKRAIYLSVRGTFKPGDPPPTGYLDWHEWADVQRKAGIRQKQCGRCGLWNTPQELSNKTIVSRPRDRHGNVVEIEAPICLKCAAKE